MRTFAGMAAGVILVAVLAGCAVQGPAGGDSASAPSATAAAKPPTGRPATPGGAETVEGGCGGTELLRGAKPRWTDGAGVGSLQMPYALSDNGDVAAFVFGHPLEAREPEPYSDKILAPHPALERTRRQHRAVLRRRAQRHSSSVVT